MQRESTTAEAHTTLMHIKRIDGGACPKHKSVPQVIQKKESPIFRREGLIGKMPQMLMVVEASLTIKMWKSACPNKLALKSRAHQYLPQNFVPEPFNILWVPLLRNTKVETDDMGE